MQGWKEIERIFERVLPHSKIPADKANPRRYHRLYQQGQSIT